MPRTQKQGYSPLTPKLMMQLAAPHTWPASIFPVLVALSCAMATGGVGSSGFSLGGMAGLASSVSGVMTCVLLAISVLMQSAVNTINDYFDYVKGTDTVENQQDPTDAVLVYNDVNPKAVLAFAIALIVAAFLLGIYVIFVAGWIPLVIALVGVLVIFLYSGGRTPISYLPIGELVSGVTMGGLITLASYQALTMRFDALVLLVSLPVILGIALIMATNNTCDIDKDIEAKRRTLPVMLGHAKSVKLYHALVYAWMVSTCVLVLLFFTRGWVVLPFMLLSVHPLGRALLANPLTPQSRGAAFGQVTSMNIAMGAFYCAAILASCIV
ncbi:MAG: prenyltransferase [Eggerthellaceae bacterium]|nr:prenyltransferase [Eggerthellaceae bacterium]